MLIYDVAFFTRIYLLMDITLPSKAAFTLAKLARAKGKNFSPLYLARISTPFTQRIPICIKPV